METNFGTETRNLTMKDDSKVAKNEEEIKNMIKSLDQRTKSKDEIQGAAVLIAFVSGFLVAFLIQWLNENQESPDAKCGLTYNRVDFRRQKSIDLQVGGIERVPLWETIVCPSSSKETERQKNRTNALIGFDTLWLFENTATTKVVVKYLPIDPAMGNEERFLQVVQPKQRIAMNTFHGQIFVVRQELPDGSHGPIILQDRIGFIPIGMNATGVKCPQANVSDSRRLSHNTSGLYQQPPGSLPCNMVHVGFRNMGDCPINGYWINSEGQEIFGFHLGVLDIPPPGYILDWASRTKLIQTFEGHRFLFRWENNNEVVENVTIQHVKAVDCVSRSPASGNHTLKN